LEKEAEIGESTPLECRRCADAYTEVGGLAVEKENAKTTSETLKTVFDDIHVGSYRDKYNTMINVWAVRYDRMEKGDKTMWRRGVRLALWRGVNRAIFIEDWSFTMTAFIYLATTPSSNNLLQGQERVLRSE
jgi:hypothetical protein